MYFFCLKRRPFALINTLLVAALWLSQSGTVFAQDYRFDKTYTDSLRTVIKKGPEDTNIIIPYILLADALKMVQTQEALKTTEKALAIATRLNWPRGMAMAYLERSTVLFEAAQYQQAISFALQAREAIKKVAADEDSKNAFIARIDQTLGIIHTRIGNFRKALEFLIPSQKAFFKYGDTTEAIIGGLNIGQCYMNNLDYKNGESYLKETLKMAEQYQVWPVVVRCYTNLGFSMKWQKNYPASITYFRASLQLAQAINDISIVAQSYAEQADNFLRINRLDSVEYLAKIGLKWAQSLQSREMQRICYRALTKFYERKGQFAKALETFKIDNAIKDSITNDTKKEEVVQLEMSYQMKQQEELAKAKLESEQQIRIIISVALIILVFAAILSFLFYKKRRDALDRQKDAEFATSVAESELRFLRLQMNPHFLFNALNSIADFIRKNNLELADRYLTRFARLMRQTLEYSAQKEISLQEDLSTLELYLSLEQLRLNNAFSYQIEIDPGVDLEHTLVPPMLLQPFVENSIWHGFARISNGGIIHIHIKKEGDLLQYNVEDNGSGLDNTKSTNTTPQEKKSMGVSITRERIAILNKIRSGNGGLNIVGTGQGTRVLLSIPFLLND